MDHISKVMSSIYSKKIVLVDSFSSRNPQNDTSERLRNIIFGKTTLINFESFYLSRKQFDSNSCGAWLISGIYSYLNPSTEVTDRRVAFKTCYELLDLRVPEVSPVDKNSPPPPPESVSHHLESSVSPPPPESVSHHIESSVSPPPPESVSHPYREAVCFSSAQFLINALTNDPSRSKYNRSSPPKGMRTNYFYITDSSIADVTADDNGAYLKTRKTTRTYSFIDEKVNTVYGKNEEYYYNKKVAFNRYLKQYIPAEKVVSLNRAYGKSKSFPLTKSVITI